ncbi:MAG: PocR ligand-binding domain-containing protein [Chloroflexi bacterium]|nr:PocR ligand-binding domain-containing protein [Chloroflexota bacterium]
MADLLTTNQVQDLLQIDRTTIYRMVESGRLPAIRVGKQWRFPRPEIERWLQTQTVMSAPASGSTEQPAISPHHVNGAARAGASSTLRDLLPITCSQFIQDAFADILGVMMVVTDMQGQPVTKISNPCGFYTALTQDPNAVSQCIRGWQQLAADPAMGPKFYPSEMGLLCARGLIRVGSELKGMAVIGGIAPEVWPPSAEQMACLAETFDLNAADVAANADAVYRLDRAAQEKALRSVQRVADIFSHIAEERNELCGRLQAIASLTAL